MLIDRDISFALITVNALGHGYFPSKMRKYFLALVGAEKLSESSAAAAYR